MLESCGPGSPEDAPRDVCVGSVLWAWGVWWACHKWRDIGCMRRKPLRPSNRSPSARVPVCLPPCVPALLCEEFDP